MFGTDTAKRDLLLIALGLLAAGFFYWFYPIVHPLNHADSSLGNQPASERITAELNRLGFNQDEGALTSYRVNSDILNFVQTELSEQDADRYRSGSAVRNVIPAFYWHSQRKILRNEPVPEPVESEQSEWLVTVHLSESGELLAFQNPSNLFPQRTIETSFFEQYQPGLISRIQQIRTDSLAFDSMQFQLTGNRSSRNNTIDQSSSDTITLGREDAVQMGIYHLELSGWPSDFFSAGDPEPLVVKGVEIARIQFSGTLPEISPAAMEVTLDILPTGTLLSMDYQLAGDAAILSESWGNVRSGITVVIIFLISIWLLVLFFIRIRLRLVDIKLSVLIAVLAGFASPLIFLMRQIFEFAYSYSAFAVQDGFGLLLGLGFMAAISSLVFFITTAISDSLTREKWIGKLKTFDLVRIAMVYNRPVGLVLIRSVIYAFLILAMISLLVYMLPDSYITVSERFRADSTLLPSLEVIITSSLFYLLIVQAVFMISAGKLSGLTKRPVWIVLLSTVMFIFLNYTPVNFGPLSTDLIVLGAIGAAAGLIYIKEDFLTVFLSLVLMGIHLLSASGWVMELSPDLSVFYVSLLLTVVLLLLGAFGFYRGEPVEELPEYVPEYINELKRDERIKQELQIARAVQQSFLPTEMPNERGFEIAAICTPALETGGDYYDFIKMGEDQLAVAIGDVSGKGIEAAFYMTFTKGVLHALSEDILSTSEMLTRINNLFLKNARKGTFISLIFGIIDFKSSTFRFSRGGHNPLLHFCADSGKVKEYKPSGIGLGMANEELFRIHIKESKIEMKRGDILVLFTDGVVEATNSRGHFYGDARLHSALKRSSKLTADKIIKALSDDLTKFGEGSEPHDDMTTIVIKKT